MLEKSACFYICGRTGFAASVLSSLKKVIRKYTHSDTEADEVFRKLIADHTIMLFLPPTAEQVRRLKIFIISPMLLCVIMLQQGIGWS